MFEKVLWESTWYFVFYFSFHIFFLAHLPGRVPPTVLLTTLLPHPARLAIAVGSNRDTGLKQIFSTLSAHTHTHTKTQKGRV